MDWNILLSTFGLVFVAELGDKTQLAVVTQTCKYRRPWAVFLGAALALTTATALGAAGGRLLSQFLPRSLLQAAAALAFILMGALVARAALRAYACPTTPMAYAHAPDTVPEAGPPATPWDWKAFASTFGLLFVAELGDKTQLAVLSLASQRGSPTAVFLGGALALTAVTALGVVGGEGLCRLIPERLLLWLSAAAFVAIGVLLILGVL